MEVCVLSSLLVILWMGTVTGTPGRPPSGASISVDDVQQVARAGGTLAIKCDITDLGDPLSNILWFKGPNTKIPILNTTWREDKSQWLVIYNVSLDQGGPYSCMAKNIHGWSQRSREVTVPVIAPFKVEDRFPKGDTLRPMYTMKTPILILTISGTHFGEAMLYRFVKQPDGQINQVVVPNAVSQTIVYGDFLYGQKAAEAYGIKLAAAAEVACNNVTDLNGEYRFIIKKREPARWDDRLDIKFNVDVQYPPLWKNKPPTSHPADIGVRNVSMSCDICSNPVATFTWKLNSEDLPTDVIATDQSKSTIIIPEVKDHHFGTYQCSAANVIEGINQSQTFDFAFGNAKQNNVDTDGEAVQSLAAIWIMLAIFIVGVIAISIIVYWHKEMKKKDGKMQNHSTSRVVANRAGLKAHHTYRIEDISAVIREPKDETEHIYINCDFKPRDTDAAMQDKDTGEHYDEHMTSGCPAKEPMVHLAVGDNNDLYAQPMKKEQGPEETVVPDESNDIYTQPMKTATAAKETMVHVTVDDYNDLYAQPMKEGQTTEEPMARVAVGDNNDLYAQPTKKEEAIEEEEAIKETMAHVAVGDNNDLYAQPLKKEQAIKQPMVADEEILCDQPRKTLKVTQSMRMQASPRVMIRRPSEPPPPVPQLHT